MKNLISATTFLLVASMANAESGAYLQITVVVDDSNRAEAAAVYAQYKQPFLTTIEGAEQKSLLIRDEDVQVLHGFDTVAHAQAYLDSPLFNEDIVTKLGPLFASDPEIRIFAAN